MAQAIWAVGRGGFDMMTTAYCRNWLGYEVTCSTAWPTSSGGAQGGVVLRTKERRAVSVNRVHALSWAERGKLQACHRTYSYPTYHCVPAPVNFRASAVTGWGPETFQGTHRHWVP